MWHVSNNGKQLSLTIHFPQYSQNKEQLSDNIAETVLHVNRSVFVFVNFSEKLKREYEQTV